MSDENGISSDDQDRVAYYCQNWGATLEVANLDGKSAKIVGRKIPGVCLDGSEVEYVKNAKPANQLMTVIEVETIHDGKHVRYHECFVAPEGGEALLGCVIPGPTQQRFDRKIKAAECIAAGALANGQTIPSEFNPGTD